jgi:6-pyruvoyltetrahydropterin/6-carboxytetrahydropterin synthase
MPGIYEIFVTTQFAAAHALTGHGGDCARLHGHNWVIEVAVRCTKLDELGMALDFGALEGGVKEILQGLDHYHLNELPAFQGANPTAENLARFLYLELGRRLNSEMISVSRVKVSETKGVGAVYWEE